MENTEPENTEPENTEPENTEPENTEPENTEPETQSTKPEIKDTEAEAQDTEAENTDSIEIAGKFYQVHRLPSRQRNAILPLDQILPAFCQPRRYIDEIGLQELGRSIQEIGLIEPIVVRFVIKEDGSVLHDLYQLIAGQRRLLSTQKYTDFTTIEACLVMVSDEEAIRIAIDENLRREDLTVIEKIESYVLLIDQQLQDKKNLQETYLAMGETPLVRVKNLLTKLDNVRRSRERESALSPEDIELSNNFVGQVDEIFKKSVKNLNSLSFLRHHLPLVFNSNDKILSTSAQYDLRRSQIHVLNKIARDFPQDFEALLDKSQAALILEREGIEGKIHLGEMSAKRLNSYYRSLQSKKQRNHKKETRILSSPNQRSFLLSMIRLGIPHQRILERLEITRTTLEKAIAEEKNLKLKIQTCVEAGEQEVYEIANELECSEALVWSMVLEGLGDEDRFDILGWKMSVESNWAWNASIPGFGNPNSQIIAKGQEDLSPLLIAHLLTFFVPKGGMVWIPETSTGVISDTCLAFGRRCWSWNGNDLRFRRPDIEFQAWNLEENSWPSSKERPDLFFAQTEFWSSTIRNSWTHSNGQTIREKYKQQLCDFFQQVHQNGKVGGRLALLADEERNYEDHPASQEFPEWRFGQYEYMKCLEEAGWVCTHSIPCPRPKLSISSKEKKKLRKSRILTENHRSLLIATRQT